MKRLFVLSVICIVLISGSAFGDDDNMPNFLSDINQKVAGYLSKNNKSSINDDSYKDIVYTLCPQNIKISCFKKAQMLFNTYRIHADTIEGTHRVLACSQDERTIVAENVFCSVHIINVSYHTDNAGGCSFSDNWREIAKPFCPKH